MINTVKPEIKNIKNQMKSVSQLICQVVLQIY